MTTLPLCGYHANSLNLDSFLHTRSIKEVRFPFLTSSSFFKCCNNFSLKRIEIIFFAI